MTKTEKERESRKSREYYEDQLALPPGADRLCPFRPCYVKSDVPNGLCFKPCCSTRREIGCPAWRDAADDEVDAGAAIRWSSDKLKLVLGKRAPWSNRVRKAAFQTLDLLGREGGMLG